MILTCLVTHDRLAYTQRCVESLLATMRPADRLIIVDNASPDLTAAWLLSRGLPAILNGENRYPGAACNQGWDYGLAESVPDFLHRSDNDIEYLPGWQAEVESAFSVHPGLALLGILNLHEDRGVPFPDGEGIEPVGRVGGNVVMPVRLFRAGLRWDERPWGAVNEDGLMSAAAAEHGQVAMLVRTIAHNMAFCRYGDYPEYYNRTAAIRGYRAETSV